VASERASKEFLVEAEEIIEKLNIDLIAFGDFAEHGECDPELLNGIFRGAHSLKGISGMFGYDDITDLAHHLENLLDSLRMGKVALCAPVVEVLLGSVEMLSRLVNGKVDDEKFTLDITPVYTRIDEILKNDGTKGEDSLSSLQLDPEIQKALTEYEEHRFLENLKRGRTLLLVHALFPLHSFDVDLSGIHSILKGRAEVISTLPSASSEADKIAFQLLVATADSAASIQELLPGDHLVIEDLSRKQDHTSPPPTEAPPIPSEIPAPATETSDIASLRSQSQTVRVDIEKLDYLMNIVGELVLSKSAIADFADRLKAEGENERSRDLQKATRTLERRLYELQKGVMEVRMVPVSQLFDKLNRVVRRISSEHGKKVVIDIRGAETELDKLIIENLSDPLVHIIRNAIDHGIESSAERLASGKPERGTICLWAAQKGNNVTIEIRDDGRGIDPEKVKTKAVERGLISKGADLSRQDIFNLLFTPGFSTKDEVSDLSGRGVGMDVVQSNIAELSGMVEMDSRVGEGTCIAITLPITLAIIKALIVRCCEKTYAIPISSVLETLMVNASKVRTIERREVIDLRQTTLPLLHLSKVFNLPAPATRSDNFFVAVIGHAEKRMGIVVNELLGQQDVVIKSLGTSLSFVKGIAGAADLGNNKTILVIDVGGLMNEALRGEMPLHV
jgi:two-component system, chemotaxis family, sensor kinase CheA